MSSQSPTHHRVSHPQHYHNNNSPTTTLSEDDSNSEPNDLRTNQKSRHHSSGTFGYPFFSASQHNSGSLASMASQHSQHTPGQQYVATNECRLIEYRGARIAAFLSANRSQCSEYLLCLPQAFELFLKHLVGGLHTVYTKLKRLDIVPIVCNVEQVRILRGLGAIQPGVNRCKLLSTQDFDVLYKDCTTARPGRPPKRSSVTGIVSPVPASYTPGTQQHNAMPFLGYPTAKKPRFSDDTDYGSENLDLKQHNSVNTNTNGNSTAATAAAMLAANGYSAAFPFLQHFSGGSTPTPQQQQQLVAAAAALGLPALPPRFSNSSPPPAIASHHGNNGNATSDSTSGGVGPDFNPTAAYLWLLSQQQQQIPNSAALNLSARTAAAINSTGTNAVNANAVNNNINSSNTANNNSITNNTNNLSANVNNNNINNNTNNKNINNNANITAVDDSTDDDDDEDDVESNNSSNHSNNPVSSSGFNGMAYGKGGASETASNRNSSTTPPHPAQQQSQPPEHCLETLLRNIEGLLAIAAHNARQQQTQLHLQKAELRAELAVQLEREREMREHLEKQLNEEQKIRMLYQKRFKKERRFRRKLEHELHQKHQIHQNQQQITQNKQQITQNTQQVSLKSSPTPPPPQPPPQQTTETID